MGTGIAITLLVLVSLGISIAFENAVQEEVLKRKLFFSATLFLLATTASELVKYLFSSSL